MKKWFLLFLGTLFSCFSLLLFIDLLYDPFGIHQIQNQRVENLATEYSFLIPPKLSNHSKLYILGTSRTLRFDIAEIQKISKKKTTFLGISGSDISQWNLLLYKIRKHKASAIIGLDFFSLSKTYGKSNTKSQTLLNVSLNNESFFYKYLYFLNPLYLQTLSKTIIKNFTLTRTQYFCNLNNEQATTPIITVKYNNFQLWNKEIDIFVKQLKNTDYIVIFPEYYKYYCFYQDDRQLLLDQYLQVISKIVLESDAKVWIFMDINPVTTNRDNYDENAWHFKPKIASIITQDIFSKKPQYGILLTKANLAKEIHRIRKNIFLTCTQSQKYDIKIQRK